MLGCDARQVAEHVGERRAREWRVQVEHRARSELGRSRVAFDQRYVRVHAEASDHFTRACHELWLQLDATRRGAREQMRQEHDFAETGSEIEEDVVLLDGHFGERLDDRGNTARVVTDELRAEPFHVRRGSCDAQVLFDRWVALRDGQRGQPLEQLLAPHVRRLYSALRRDESCSSAQIVTLEATHRAVHAVFRIEAPRLIAGLTRLVKDLGLAEELAQDALVTALERWPEAGVPDNPGAWLMATAKRRAIDELRRNKRWQGKEAAVGYEIEAQAEFAAPDLDAALDDHVGDDLLRLVFTSCHPVLPTEARVALTLRLLGGLTTAEIARAFVLPEPTIAQRIVRAKRTLAESQVPFEVPRASELAARLASVLVVVYLIFNEGYSATAGADWMRPGLCEDALRLARILAGLTPNEPEVHGLVALLEIQASRSKARVGQSGEPILLLEQNRARWDQLLIGRGLAALARAEELGGAGGPYALQAAIAACHARARTADATDWPRIAALYATLSQRMPSPIVELNRAVAVSMAFGPGAGLAIVEALSAEPALQNYHLLPSVRGDLLSKLGRHEEARLDFERAASLTQNARERELLAERARRVGGSVPPKTA